MRTISLVLLLGCDKGAKPGLVLGPGPIPCTVEATELQRKEADALLKAGKVDAAHELLARQSCGPDEEMSVELIEALAWVDIARTELLYKVGNFDWCQSSATPNTMPDGPYSKFFEPGHPVIKAFERLAKPCEEALAKQQAIFTAAPRCHYKRDQTAYRLPDASGCLVFEKCGASYLERDNAMTMLTIDKGNLLESGCNHLGHVGFGQGEILVEAGGRDHLTWYPYSRHIYKLDGTTLTFVREVRTPADLEAR